MGRPIILASDLDTEITIERWQAGEGFADAGKGEWVPVDRPWAQVRGVLPSRDERVTQGLDIATRRARVRIWWQDGITPDMRIVVDGTPMQIIGGPVEIGRHREGLEMMVEAQSAGGGA